MSDIAIKVKNLCKIYKLYDKPVDRVKESLSIRKRKYSREYYALKDISFEIKKGESIGIVGSNGAGKSTLLKIITGVLSPTYGTVQVNGRISALLELGAGFNPEYTGIENIYLNGTMMGFKKEEIDAKIGSILDFADIGEFVNQPVKTYSSGMFVRLAFAVAISIEPDILIVDEALSVGDTYFQAKCMTKIKEFFSKGKTVMFVTHDTNTVKSLCKTAIYLKEGQVVSIGAANEVVDMYQNYVRDCMMSSNRNGESVEPQIELDNFNVENKVVFKENSNFEKLVYKYRQGFGNAIVTELEVFDKDNQLVREIGFNEEIKIRLHIKFINDCRICIGYHIRDEKNIEILGSNTLIEDIGELKGKAGDRVVVDFETKVPLVEGNYNITTVLSTIIVHNRTAKFEDYTQGGYIFKVLENEKSKIWNKVYVNNHIKIMKI